MKDDSIHVVCNVGIFCLHPEVTLTCARGTPDLHVEEAVRAATAPDARKRELICVSPLLLVQLNQRQASVGQAQQVATQDVAGVAKPFVQQRHLPHVLECGFGFLSIRNALSILQG